MHLHLRWTLGLSKDQDMEWKYRDGIPSFFTAGTTHSIFTTINTFGKVLLHHFSKRTVSDKKRKRFWLYLEWEYLYPESVLIHFMRPMIKMIMTDGDICWARNAVWQVLMTPQIVYYTPELQVYYYWLTLCTFIIQNEHMNKWPSSVASLHWYIIHWLLKHLRFFPSHLTYRVFGEPF